jgi:hypothetical protein
LVQKVVRLEPAHAITGEIYARASINPDAVSASTTGDIITVLVINGNEYIIPVATKKRVITSLAVEPIVAVVPMEAIITVVP